MLATARPSCLVYCAKSTPKYVSVYFANNRISRLLYHRAFNSSSSSVEEALDRSYSGEESYRLGGQVMSSG